MRPPPPETVAVVIPTRDRRQLLRRALASVRAQTRVPDEVVVVDDGSSDGTAGELESLNWVTLLRRPHGGVSAARNAGIAAATSRWIAFLDSDDEWRPEKLSAQLEAVATAPGTRICHTDETWIRNGRRVNPGKRHAKSGGWIFRNCLPLCVISPSSAMMERSLLEELGGFDESLPACEDYDMWLRVCARYPVAFVDEPLVIKHGGHDDQLSRRFWGMDRFRISALEKIIASGALNEPDRRAAVRTLVEKTRIYLAGARKRDKQTDVNAYERLLARYESGTAGGGAYAKDSRRT